MNTTIDTSQDNVFTSMGVPAGFQIQEIDINNMINSSQNQINKNMMNFAQKQASNSYYKYSGSVITDLAEFVEDALKMN